MRRTMTIAAVLAVIFALSAGWTVSTAQAGLTDKLKKKVEDKAAMKVEGVVDKKTGEKPAAEEATSEEAASAKPGGSTERVSEVSTKFDYVPGDRVLLFDDFTQDELGEFPAQWKLVEGTFEVAEMGGERWLRCMSADGHLRMKRPATAPLPEFWTLEFDFYGVDLGGAMALTVTGLSERGSAVWEVMYPHAGHNMAFRCGDIFSTTPLEGSPVPGRHHVMLMARGTGLKAYMDRERLANVPDVSGQGMPVDFDFRLWAPTRPMITNVRFAEGCRPPKDMLAEGKLVTYGIRFDSGSDTVLPDSAPVLRQVAAYMEANGGVKLKITGHTDNVGGSASNLDLSKRRAASVAKVLTEQFKIAGDRFTTDGKGDTEKVADNATAEGRAMNRRVEFAKS